MSAEHVSTGRQNSDATDARRGVDQSVATRRDGEETTENKNVSKMTVDPSAARQGVDQHVVADKGRIDGARSAGETPRSEDGRRQHDDGEGDAAIKLMQVCVCVCVCVYAYLRAFTCKDAYVHKLAHIHMHTHTYSHIYKRTATASSSIFV